MKTTSSAKRFPGPKPKPETGIFSSKGSQKQDRAPKQTPAVKAARSEAMANYNNKTIGK